MGKTVVVLIMAALVAVGVWYAVTHFPRPTAPEASPAAAPQGPAADSAPPGLPALLPVCGGRCGSLRWPVKTLTDADRDLVDLRPIAATIESLTALPFEPGGNSTRGGSAERHVFSVMGYFAGRRSERDGDIHVIVFGLTDERTSLIAEIPSPTCEGACRSGVAERFAAARQAFTDCLGAPNPTDEPIVVRIEGVGFFDREHRQSGAAANSIELHPVLRFECLR